MASYTVTQVRTYIDTFDEIDIPEGMSYEEYAESRYEDGYGTIDSHELMVTFSRRESRQGSWGCGDANCDDCYIDVTGGEVAPSHYSTLVESGQVDQ